MADPIYAEQQKLEELISILKKAASALQDAGQGAEATEILITKLEDALAGAIDVVPNLEELSSVIERIKSGARGLANLGPSVGRNVGINEAIKGWKLYEETVGKHTTDATKQLADELQSLNKTDLEDLAEELRKITGTKYPVEEITAFAKVLQELDSVAGLSKEQLDRLDDLADAASQVDLGWTKAIDTLNSLSKVDISKVAKEYKELSGTDLGTREIENLLSVGKRAADSIDIQLSTLQKALINVRKAGEIKIEVTEPEKIEVAKELIQELKDNIALLSSIDLSKLSDEILKLGKVTFPVEQIKAFTENIDEILEKDPSKVAVIEEIFQAIKNLREVGEIPRSIKELNAEIQKLSETDLSKLSEEYTDLTGIHFPVENIKSFVESLADGKIELSGARDAIHELDQALTIITDSSTLTTKEIRQVGKAISELEKINLQRLVEELKKLTGVEDISVEDIREFANTLRDLENREIISEDSIRRINQLNAAFNEIRREQALPFEDLAKILNTNALAAEDFSEEFGNLLPELNRASSGAGEFSLELQFIKDRLADLGVKAKDIKIIADHFKELKTIESPAKLFQELSQYGLPDEEVKEFANSFLLLRKNSERLLQLASDLQKLGIAKESIRELVSNLRDLDLVFSKLDASYNMTKAGLETVRISSEEVGKGLKLGFSFEIDEATRKLINFAEETVEAIPAVEKFSQVLSQLGVPQPVIEDLIGETFDKGATDFATINIKDVNDNLTQYSTTVKYGEDATKRLVFLLNDAGIAFKTLAEATATNPLEDFIEGLQSFDVPKLAIDTIVGETFGEGKALSRPQIKEVNDEITRLTGTIQGAGGITKAYVVYFDELGNVMRELPVEEVSVSMQDFTDVLSSRVGAIDNVNKMLERYGFELSSLKKLESEAGSGITRLEFAMKSMGGATNKLTLHVTEFGKVLTDTQRRFRTFASGIARNIGESFKWAVAITAVYGPLRKLQDLIQLSIDNESKLADIGVVLGKNTAELQNIFADTVKAAKATGESLNGVIEGYALAYRATGNLATETERAEVANQLLIDSLVLSKLSTLSQAEAMDTLVAGLLQSNYSLDQGAELLNKWVAVSKIANVTIDTLATSFAIMATAAEGVGLNFDELNAIIAVVAANTELSAKEAGNAVRAFVSGFQTDNARNELAKFGIAVEDLNGDARNFMSVMYDIKELFDAGLIDDAELNKIGTALGGRGARRGAQFTTFLKSLDEVQGYVTVSAEAQGDAYEALGIKMDTVQTSLTNLATSFQELANTVGTEGGILDLLKFFVELLDSITQRVGEFIKVMGKAGPLLIAGGGLLAYGANTGRLKQMPGQLGMAVTGLLGGTSFGQKRLPQEAPMPISDYQNYSIYGKTMAQSFGGWVTNNAANLGLLIGQGTIAAFNIADKDWDGLGGQIGGGIAGFLLSGGNPIGAIIGSTIVEAIVNGLADAGTSGELKDAFSGMFADVGKEEDQSQNDRTQEERLLDKQKNLNDQLQRTLGSEWITGIKLWSTTVDNFLRGLIGVPKLWKEELTATELAGGSIQEVIAAYQRKGVAGARGKAMELGVTGFGLTVSDEDIKKRIEELQQLEEEINRINQELEDLGKGKFAEGTPAATELSANWSEYSDLLKREVTKAQDEFNQELIDGDITIKQYNESMERMGQEGESIMQIFTSLDDVMGNSAENLLLVLDVISRTSAEEINIVTTLSNGIADLKRQIEELQEAGDTGTVIIKQEELDQALFKLNAYFNQIREAQRQPLIQLATEAPQIIDIRPEEFNRVAEEAGRILEERIQEYIRLGLLPKDTTIEEVKAAGEMLAIAFAEPFGDATYRTISEALAALLPEAAENLRGLEEITPAVPEPSRFRIQTVDMTESAFLAAYEAQLSKLKDAFGAYWQPTLETIGIIFKDGTDVLHLDNLAMQLAMQDLIDVNQKQLEGVYNLPTDASFYVPFQGYKLGFDGGGGGLSGAASDLSGSADQLDAAAQEIMDAALALAEDIYAPEIPLKKPMTFEEYPKFQMPEMLGPPELQTPRFDTEAPLETEKETTLWGKIVDFFIKLFSQPPAIPAMKGAGAGTRFEKIGTEVDAVALSKQLATELEGAIKATQPEITDERGTLRGPIIDGADKIVVAIQQFSTNVVTELQNISTLFANNLFNYQDFPENFEKVTDRMFPEGASPIPAPGTYKPEDSLLSLFLKLFGMGFPTTGLGTGIGPQLDFSKLDTAADKLSNFADTFQPTYQYSTFGPQQQQIGVTDTLTEFNGVLDLLNQKITNLSGFTTNLKISSTYTANLIVDGRTLAQIIKPYLYSDMIRYEDSATSVTKTIVA